MKLTTLAAMFEAIKNAGYKLDGDANEIAVVDITATPLESIWGVKEVNYGDPAKPFVPTGWGEDRQTPWGPLPGRIVLVRKDVWDKLFAADNNMEPKSNLPPLDGKLADLKTELERPKLGKLNWDGWKPAPGFEDFRK